MRETNESSAFGRWHHIAFVSISRGLLFLVLIDRLNNLYLFLRVRLNRRSRLIYHRNVSVRVFGCASVCMFGARFSSLGSAD